MENASSAVASLVEVPVPDQHVQKVIDGAEVELRHLIEERVEVTKRICTVKQIIIGLANLYGDVVLDDALSGLLGRDGGARQPGITRACRQVLLDAGRPMSAREVCDQIQQSVPVLLARHKDPMATIYTILGRLVEYGEVRVLPGARGQRTWIWAGDRTGESGMSRAEDETIDL
jgi:hypothetical protein